MKAQRGPQKRTQVIKIQASPPDQQDPDDGQYLAPAAKKRAKRNISQFFEQNQFIYRPQASQGDTIRYIPSGSMPASMARQEEYRKKMTEQYLAK